MEKRILFLRDRGKRKPNTMMMGTLALLRDFPNGLVYTRMMRNENPFSVMNVPRESDGIEWKADFNLDAYVIKNNDEDTTSS